MSTLQPVFLLILELILFLNGCISTEQEKQNVDFRIVTDWPYHKDSTALSIHSGHCLTDLNYHIMTDKLLEKLFLDEKDEKELILYCSIEDPLFPCDIIYTLDRFKKIAEKSKRPFKKIIVVLYDEGLTPKRAEEWGEKVKLTQEWETRVNAILESSEKEQKTDNKDKAK